MKKRGNIQIEVDGVRCSWMYDFGGKKSKSQHCARCVYYLSEITTLTNNLKNTVFSRTHRPSK